MTTFDIRMKEPNREPVLHQGAIHTIEHLAATFLRNDPEWRDRIIYWGPMGCLTGNYLLHDLPMARFEARKYLEEVLDCIKPENMVYPSNSNA